MLLLLSSRRLAMQVYYTRLRCGQWHLMRGAVKWQDRSISIQRKFSTCVDAREHQRAREGLVLRA